MQLICMYCNRLFEGNKSKFCSQSCRDSHIVSLEKRIQTIEDQSRCIEKDSKD